MARTYTPSEAAEEVFDQLMFLKGQSPGTNGKIRDYFANKVINDSIKYFLADPMMIQTEGPIIVVGGIYGDFYDLVVIFEMYGYPPKRKYLFLGDIVGFGPQNCETVMLLCCLKILYPTYMFILRGKNEIKSVNIKTPFYKEAKTKYGDEYYELINNIFNNLPMACVIGEKIFCVSAGIPKEFTSTDQFTSFIRPIDADTNPMVNEAIFTIPDPEPNQWGIKKQVDRPTMDLQFITNFLERNNLEIFVRSSTMVADGYEFTFQGDSRFLTISSKPSWTVKLQKSESKENTGIVLDIDPTLKTFFRTIRPLPWEYREYYLSKKEIEKLRAQEPKPLRQGTIGIIPSYAGKKAGTKKK